MWYAITYPLPNFNGYTVEVLEWISNFIPHIIVLTCYPCLDQSYTMLVKGAPDIMVTDEPATKGAKASAAMAFT